jgi:small multidrug resistance pump
LLDITRQVASLALKQTRALSSHLKLNWRGDMPKHYVFLFLAIIAETIGTAALQTSNQFTKLVPSIVVVVAYAVSFYLLAYALKFMPVGIVYALWSGLGIVAIAAIGYFWFGQALDGAAVFGITLILIGILVIQVFSNTNTH